MASTLVDLVKITSNSTGTGAITLGSPVAGYRGLEALTNGEVYSYSIQDGDAWEFGRGTFMSATGQFIRTPIDSSDGGAAINLRQNAQIAFVALSEDLDAVQLSNAAVVAADQVAIDAAQVAADRAIVEAGSKAVVNGEAVYPNSYATTVPQGVINLSNDGIATGSGGTPGTYAGGVTGGPSGFSWEYSIGLDGKIASYDITSPGISTTTDAPILSFPSGSVTGAIVPTATVSTRIAEASGYWVISSDGATLDLFSNVAGVASPVLDPTGDQVKVFVSAGAEKVVDAAEAWAQSSTAPDPTDPTSKSAKTWAQVALAAASRFLDLEPITGWAFRVKDAVGKIAGGFRPDGTWEVFKAKLPASTKIGDQPSVSLADRIFAAAVGSMFNSLDPVSGYVFRIKDTAGKIVFGIPLSASRPIAGYFAKAKYAETAGALSAPPRPISCFGDSLTFLSFASALASVSGRTANNYGIIGELSAQIAARQGGDPTLLTISGGAIPADASTIVDVSAYTVNPMNSNGDQSLIGYLCGIEVTLYRIAGSPDTLRIKRNVAGTQPIPVPAQTPWVPKLGIDHQNDIQTFRSGRNDATTNAANLVANATSAVSKSVSFLKHDRFIVIGCTTKSDGAENKGSAGYNAIVQLNNTWAGQFGRRFFDARRYLIDFGLADAGLTATSDDLTAIANDVIPPQLMNSDMLHTRGITENLVAAKVWAMMLAEGW